MDDLSGREKEWLPDCDNRELSGLKVDDGLL
jgi:hypothetical protein